jgi:hypothetical protein
VAAKWVNELFQKCPKYATYRSRDIGTSDSLRGSIKVVERGGLDDLSDDL